jgi:thiol-disulfide isomerase/thioredoxin
MSNAPACFARILTTSIRRFAGASLIAFLMALPCLPFCAFANADEFAIPAFDEEEISVTRFAAEGDYLMIWLAPEYGFRKAHRELATQMPAQQIEVWQSDISESLFLPLGTASIKQLDGSYVADLIEYAHAETGKKIVVAGDSYASMSALRGARQWQKRAHDGNYLLGAILFSPYSYAYLPELGQAPEYLPIVEATNIPLLIYQAQNSAIVSQFPVLLEKLRKHGSPIYTRGVTGVMSLFYEEESTDAMREGAQPIPGTIRQMLPLLARHEVPRKPVRLRAGPDSKSGIDIYLKEFKGQSKPPTIDLLDITGNRLQRTNFAGKVSLVNFWATWCPPCIEEIPSLNRLKRQMQGRPFELISINYAEDKATVLDFMQRVEVDFPVLLDSNGAQAETWKVISYPSTFVIDMRGHIRYGVNAAIEWDSPELVQQLEALMQ